MAFGDSPADIYVAEEIHDQGRGVSFGYVGYKDLEKKDYGFKIIRPSDGEKFDKGTLSILKSLNHVA